MAGEIYGSFEFSPKGYTRGSDVGKGQLGLPHLNPPLFLQMQLVKTHTHTGVDSVRLRASATPEMVRGFSTEEREERGIATWTGAAASAASVVLTFGTAFREAPTVIVTAVNGDAAIVVTIGSVSATGVTIFWSDYSAATHESMPIHYIIKGR